MKKELSITFFLVLALALTACAASASGGAPEAKGIPEVSASLPLEDTSQPEEDHSHQPAEADNIVPHEDVGYCGNTVTTVRRNDWLGDTPWEVSFWGEDSVALTDLLTHLDYSGDVCRCLPEYYVDTEFSEESYGINLSSGYARHGGAQVELTQEQIQLIQDILDRNPPD